MKRFMARWTKLDRHLKGGLMARWIKATKGVRYREHETRKHGLKLDRYYAIYYRVDGKQVEEGLGWASEGWTEEKAVNQRAVLKENRRRSEGPRTLREKKTLEDTKRQKEAEEKEQEEKDRLTFKELVEGHLKAPFETDKNGRKKKSTTTEQGYLKNWIFPVIGSMPLKDIAPIHLERIRADMAKKKKAARSIHYVLAIVRHIFNLAVLHNYFNGANPVKKVKLPGGDNRRKRFLTREEAAALLAKLATISPDVRDMALISLHTGMRAGEVFGLAWADVDVDRGILTLRDTKSGEDRPAFMTGAVKDIFKARERGLPSELVFPDRNGKRTVRISNTFAKAVDALKLNEGIKDRRQQVTFHSLRHTYASWHVENGTDLYAVKELLGHSDIKMTTRYSHLGENTLQAAVKRLESTLQAPAPGKVVEFKKG